MITPLRLALGLFTIIPVGGSGPAPDRRTVRRALLLAPVVGVLLAAVAAAVLAPAAALVSGQPGSGALLAAALGLLTVAALTGGLHLDGLADCADGLACRGDAERTMAVMRDAATGALGAAAIAGVLLVQASALAVAVDRGDGVSALVTAVLAGRVAVVWGATAASARADGLGAWVSGVVGTGDAVLVTAIALVVPVAVAWLDGGSTVAALAAVPAAVVVAWLALRPLVRRIGGITGDVLGARIELATAAALVVVALLG